MGGTSAHAHGIAVDWAEIEFETAQATNFDTVQKQLQQILSLPPEAKPYVGAQSAGDGGAATAFRFRTHDPDQFHAIGNTLAGLNTRFKFIGLPRLTAIEIAHDTRFEGATKHQLAEIAADRYRFCAHAPGFRWYFYREGGEGRTYIDDLTHDEVVQYFEDGWHLTDSDSKAVSLRRHMYVKVSNNNGEDKLKSAQWSARDEITLRGQAMPCQTVEELATLDFTKLAKHFTYRCLTESKSPLMTLIREWLYRHSGEQIGRRGEYPRKQRKSAIGLYRLADHTEFKSWTKADPLNRAIFRELRTLTTHWRSKRQLPSRLKSAEIAPCTESAASTAEAMTTREALTAIGAVGIESLTPTIVVGTALTIALPLLPAATTPDTPYQAQEGAARLPPQGGAAPSDGTPDHQDNNDESWRAKIAALAIPPPVSTQDRTDL